MSTGAFGTFWQDARTSALRVATGAAAGALGIPQEAPPTARPAPAGEPSARANVAGEDKSGGIGGFFKQYAKPLMIGGALLLGIVLLGMLGRRRRK